MPPPTGPRIGAKNQPALTINTNIVLAPQTLKSSAVQEIFMVVASNNTWTNRTLWKIIMTGLDGTTPVPSGVSGTSTPAPSGVSETRKCGSSTPDPSGIRGTSAVTTCVIIGTSAAPTSGGLWSPIIGNIRQSNLQNVR